MDREEHESKYRSQTDGLYAAIGRFAVKFEHVCQAMCTTITFVLHQDGLRTQSFANALLAGVTADPLRKMFAAIVAEVRGQDEAEMKVLGNVLKRIQKLTEQRNDIIHRTWFIGWASAEQEDFSIAPGWKFQSTNRGPEFKPLYYTETEFNGLSREADELTGIVLRIHGCLMLDRRFVDNFDVAADGTVRLPSLESQ